MTCDLLLQHLHFSGGEMATTHETENQIKTENNHTSALLTCPLCPPGRKGCQFPGSYCVVSLTSTATNMYRHVTCNHGHDGQKMGG